MEYEEKIQLYRHFHELSYNHQTRYLADACMKTVDINRRRVHEDNLSAAG